jgi:hypothetical protein
MADDCNNPNCGWFLYEVKIDTTMITIVRGKTIADKDAADADKPDGKVAVAKLEKIRDDYNDSTNLTIPFSKKQCGPCECKPLGDPIWEKEAEKGWKIEYTEKGWIVSCDAEVKLGKQPGICKDKKKKLRPISGG